MGLPISSPHKQALNGAILIIILIYMQLISLIMLALLQQEVKFLHACAKADGNITPFESIEKLLRTIQLNSFCLLPITAPDTLKSATVNWWNMTACEMQSNQARIQYVIEDLKQNPCAIIAKNKIAIANYYRITLRLTSAGASFASIRQAIIVKPTPMTGQVCHDNKLMVQAGVQFVTEFEGIL